MAGKKKMYQVECKYQNYLVVASSVGNALKKFHDNLPHELVEALPKRDLEVSSVKFLHGDWIE